MTAPRYDYLRFLARIGATGVHPHGQVATEMLLKALELRRGLRVLEIGCGAGATMEQIVHSHPALLTGMDVLPDMLKAAR